MNLLAEVQSVLLLLELQMVEICYIHLYVEVQISYNFFFYRKIGYTFLFLIKKQIMFQKYFKHLLILHPQKQICVKTIIFVFKLFFKNK